MTATISQTTVDTPAIQFAQALGLTNNANAISKVVFLNDVIQAEVSNALLAIDNSQASAQTDDSITEGLLDLGTPELALLNGVGTDPTSASITGALTTQQLQEIFILQQDIIGLEAAANTNDLLPLTNAAATVDLSLAAQSIANGNTTNGTTTTDNTAVSNTTSASNTTSTPENSPTTSANASTSLTPVQLEQIEDIIASVANQPLTPELLLQIQAQAQALHLNPQQISFSTIFLAHDQMDDAKNADSTDDVTIAPDSPISSVDKVAVEDGTVRS